LTILLLTLMVFTGCSRDLQPNPYTTILKQILKHDYTGGSSAN